MLFQDLIKSREKEQLKNEIINEVMQRISVTFDLTALQELQKIINNFTK